MNRAVLLRLAQAALVVGLVVSTCFALIRLAPGDPFFSALDAPGVSEEQRAVQRAAFGYDRPLPEQFVRYLGRVAVGDLGWSHSKGMPVRAVLAVVLPASMLLMATAILFGLVGGVALGAWQGWRHESRWATATDRLSLVLLSTPEFVLALLLLIGPALAWRLFPASGVRTEFGPTGIGSVLDVAHHLVLPALALALVVGAIVARHQRAAMRGVRDAEFVRAARARGVPEVRLFVRYALRNALVPVLTIMGLLLPAVVGGAVLVESVFSWPGMGSAIVGAVLGRDYPLVAGGVLVSAVGVVIGTLAADLALFWADPRQRREA